MATELIASGSTAANSGDVTVVAGVPVTVGISGAEFNASVVIEIKDNTAAWTPVGTLIPTDPVKCIYAPGVYRLRRVSGAACGAYSA